MASTLEIDINLDKDFITQYNALQAEFGEKIARLNGFADSQLSYTDFIDNFIDKGPIADKSIDANSNVSHKDIVCLERESPKPHMKLLSFNKIYYEFKKEYGFFKANQWLRSEWVGELYMHDACSASFRSYCFAYSLKDLAEKGLYFDGDDSAKPAKHLITFIDFVKEFVNFASNRTSGAVGMPDLIPYMFYFWKKDVDDGYYIRDPKYYAKQNFQRFIFAVNQTYVRDSIQSAFTNTSVFDRPYFEALFGGSEFPDGTFMIDYEEEIIEFQKWYMETMAEIRRDKMMTFPVSTISLLRQNRKFVDEEFAEWAIRHNMQWSDSNLFIDDNVSSLSNCCRLRSDIREMGYFNSVGGSALKVGSVKVSTINLARIALDVLNETNGEVDEELYLMKLKERVEIDLMALDRVRHIIKRNVEKGLLPNFSYGLIDFEHLYNTIGFTGIYEVMKAFGYTEIDELNDTYYKEEAYKFGKKIFETMRSVTNDFIKKYNCDYMINTEQIPGESAADKLMQKDKFFYPEANVYDLPLYGNQFIPLGIKTTIQERIKIAAAFDSYCSGGSILHISTSAPFDSYEKAREMIEYIADQGVTYYAFNPRIQTCHYGHAFFGKKCPVCGGEVETEYTRIVGFYTAINTWSKPRREEYHMRQYKDLNEFHNPL